MSQQVPVSSIRLVFIDRAQAGCLVLRSLCRIAYKMSYKKITRETAPKGIWNWVKQTFQIAPERSSGITFNETYRNPMPGSRPEIYKEPVTAPASDIAQNPYYARDVRRQFPATSIFTQEKVAGLLTYGNKAQPAIADGNEGLTALAKIGELQLISAIEAAQEKNISAILADGGVPPLPMGKKGRSWTLQKDEGFGNYTMDAGVAYPCRSFS